MSTSRSPGFAQQKLVAIARLLALSPRVLMLDEPASGLDPAGRDTLTAAIKKLAADGQTVCFVEHNTEMVRDIADRVVFLAQGRILADSTPEEVFGHSKLAEAYLGLS
jgi:branched-chain amino acid transport system ATP-binding protein